MGMVVSASPAEVKKDQDSVVFLKPTSVSELKNYPEKCFFIKLSSPTCPPCRQLQIFLENYVPKQKIPIVTLDVTENNEIANKVGQMYGLRSVPFFAKINADLQAYQQVTGFRQDEIQKMLDTYDPQEKYDLTK